MNGTMQEQHSCESMRRKTEVMRGRRWKRSAFRGLRASVAGVVLFSAVLVLPNGPSASAAGLFENSRGLLDEIASKGAEIGSGLGDFDPGSIGNGSLVDAVDALHDAADALKTGVEETGIAQRINDLRDTIANGTDNGTLFAAGEQSAENTATASGNTTDTGLGLPDLNVGRVVSKAEERRLAMEERLKAAAEEAGLTETIENAAENVRNRVNGKSNSDNTDRPKENQQFAADVKERFDNLRNLVQEAAENAGMDPEEIKNLTDAINEVEKTIREDTDGIRTAIEEKRLEKLIEDIKDAFGKLGIRDKSFLERLAEWATRLKEIRNARNSSSSSTDWAAFLAAQRAGNGPSANTEPNYATAFPNEKSVSEEREEEISEQIEEDAIPLAAFPELVPMVPEHVPWYRSVGVIATGIAGLGATCVISGMSIGKRMKKKA